MDFSFVRDVPWHWVGIGAFAGFVVVVFLNSLGKSKQAKPRKKRATATAAQQAPAPEPISVAPVPVAPVSAAPESAPESAPEPAPAPAPAPEPAPVEPIAAAPVAPPPATGQLAFDMSRASASDWVPFNKGHGLGAVEGDCYRLDATQGVRSLAHLPASPGRAYKVDFAVRSTADPRNGGQNNFYVGPLFVDSDGALTRGWRVQAPIAMNEGVRTGVVEAVAPPNVVSVHVGLRGPLTKENPQSDGAVGFQSVVLSEA